MSTQALEPTVNQQQSLSGVAAENAALLDRLKASYSGESFSIRFWDESVWTSAAAKPALFEIWLRTSSAWRNLMHHPDEVTLGRSYLDGELYINGDFFHALRAFPAIQLATKQSNLATFSPLSEFAESVRLGIDRLAHWGSEHSRTRDAAVVALHYDKPADFYKLFLGPTMVYSCAYFEDWSNSLDEAQRAKMDLICRKLDLKKDDNFLDVGCGWGSLVMHACVHYGVRARGITISKAQAAYAERLATIRCGDHACISERDYRELDVMHVAFDKAASVGMCEHVGNSHIDEYFKSVYATLRPGGLFLNHGITRSYEGDHHRSAFINKYVFPDGDILPLSRLVKAAEDAGFEVRDVENLREHYEETLHRWVEALDMHQEEATSLTDKQTIRIWRLYLAGSAEAFRRGEIAIHQVLLAKKDKIGRSWSFTRRTELYRRAKA